MTPADFDSMPLEDFGEWLVYRGFTFSAAPVEGGGLMVTLACGEVVGFGMGPTLGAALKAAAGFMRAGSN